MSEGEAKQAPSGGSDPKPESASSGPGMTSVSAPVTSAAPPEEEEEEEESEDESEILEESPCGRWQKRREEVGAGVRGWASAARRGGHRALLSPQPSVGGRERPLWAVRRPEVRLLSSLRVGGPSERLGSRGRLCCCVEEGLLVAFVRLSCFPALVLGE